MRNSLFWWIAIGLMVVVDIYVFQVVRSLSYNLSERVRLFVYSGYWIISIAAIALLLLLPYLNLEKEPRFPRGAVFAVILGLFFAKLLGAVFFMVDDLRRGLQWTFNRLRMLPAKEVTAEGDKITRSAFMNWMGMIVAGGFLSTYVYGMGNKYRYKVRRMALTDDKLPEGFKGLKIVQLSDIHCGSFTDKEAVVKGIVKVMEEKPDLILFTGDLVNNVASETEDYMDVFDKLSAPLGVYSVLGNHDYGDYTGWDSPEEKAANLERLKKVHEQLGWRLLMNEHVALERNGDKIALLGIENWSAKSRFPQYGDLEKAWQDTASFPYKILMSHDPSHWRAEVLTKYPDINLMLAGHTHGMQFGVEIPGMRWSPVQYMYKEWAGMYEKTPEASTDTLQRLYVNRGFGFIGYPGRVGILPEITVFEFS